MVISLADWQFELDAYRTLEYTIKCSRDHCTCPYCKNYYDNVDLTDPDIRLILSKFGIHLDGPCEVMPFEPTLVAACYRVTGRILSRGESNLHINGVPLRPEEADENTFFLWIGPLELPWTQEEDMDEVLSPANQPEFMDRMMARLLQWAEDDPISS